jgi:hypothetical protein
MECDEYVWVVYGDLGNGDVSDELRAATIERLGGLVGEGISVREPCRGESEGIYGVRESGDLQILGYGMGPPPRDITDRIQDALDQAVLLAETINEGE